MWTSIPNLLQVAVASIIPLSNPTVLICKQVVFLLLCGMWRGPGRMLLVTWEHLLVLASGCILPMSSSRVFKVSGL